MSDSDEKPEDQPGKKIVWFGKYNGCLFEELPDSYRDWCIHPDRAVFKWYTEFVELNKQFNEWRAEHQPPTYVPRSPGGEIVWFGKYKGLRFDEVHLRKGYMRWCLDPERSGCHWYNRFTELKDRYEEWLKTHRRPYKARAKTDHIRDVGQLLGRWDDNAVDQNEEYEDDGFVIPDDDNDDGDEGSDFDSAGEHEEYEQSEGATGTDGTNETDDNDSDDDSNDQLMDDVPIGSQLETLKKCSPSKHSDKPVKSPRLCRKRMVVDEEHDGTTQGKHSGRTVTAAENLFDSDVVVDHASGSSSTDSDAESSNEDALPVITSPAPNRRKHPADNLNLSAVNKESPDRKKRRKIDY